jgi:CDP-glycerol glycerophosphotransferase (TagB/SpsB family)
MVEDIVGYDTEYKKIVLYAPTWEAFHESMDYTSIAKYGVGIVKKILNDNNFILIYRPHPNTGSRRNDVLKAQKEIISMIRKNKNAFVITDVDIVSLFTVVDFAFFDNSSVMIDYLHFNKPACYIEIKEDYNLRYLKDAFQILNENNADSIIDNLTKNINEDSNQEKRKKIKDYYLGNYSYMQSTNNFIDFIRNIVDNRLSH